MSNDPLESLRQPIEPVMPRAEFADALRRSLHKELNMTTTDTTTGATGVAHRTDIGAQYRALQAHLCVNDGRAALAFYEEAFGAVTTMLMEDDDDKVGHAELQIGAVALMLADEFPEMGILSPASLGGSGVTLHLHVADVDRAFDRLVTAGATGERAPADQFHGNRTATVVDPFGHRWTLSAPVETPPSDELAERAAEGGYATTFATAPPEPASVATPRAPIQLGYFTVTVPDVDRAAAFYGALFGWAFDQPEGPPGGRYGHVNNTALPFGLTDDASMSSPHHYYRVADLDGAVVKVRELGGEVLEVTDHASGGNARCRDDQGVEFDLWKPAPGYE